MRKIRLSDTDGALFDEEMIPQDYDYLARHKATFCRMWTDQGQKFWRRYVEVFRSYILRYSLLGDLTCDASQLQGTLEFAFVVITTQFIEGKVNQAKSLLNQIADLGKNRHRFQYLDSKSVTKDPFYTKETRDIFREFFGPASEKASYIKVYLLTPVYMKFGGSVVRCLSKWMEADEIDPEDDSYFVRPAPIEINTPLCTKHGRSASSSSCASSLLCAYHLDDCNNKFYVQFMKGVPSSPVYLGFWEKKDPRFCEPENPLWNPGADTDDWRDGLTLEKFQEFYAWCSFNEAIVSAENQCQDCRARRKAKKKNKKKKKKATGTLADFGYDDASIAIDSEDSLKGTNSGVKPKVVMAMCDEGCQHIETGCKRVNQLMGPMEVLTKVKSNHYVTDTATNTTINVITRDAIMDELMKRHPELDRKTLEMQIDMMYSENTECSCTFCQLNSFDADDDSDTPPEKPQHTKRKATEKKDGTHCSQSDSDKTPNKKLAGNLDEANAAKPEPNKTSKKKPVGKSTEANICNVWKSELDKLLKKMLADKVDEGNFSQSELNKTEGKKLSEKQDETKAVSSEPNKSADKKVGGKPDQAQVSNSEQNKRAKTTAAATVDDVKVSRSEKNKSAKTTAAATVDEVKVSRSEQNKSAKTTAAATVDEVKVSKYEQNKSAKTTAAATVDGVKVSRSELKKNTNKKGARKETEARAAGRELPQSESVRETYEGVFGNITVVEKRMETLNLPLPEKEDLQAQFEVVTKSDRENGVFQTSVTVLNLTPMLGILGLVAISQREDSRLLRKGPFPKLTPQYFSQVVQGLPVKSCSEGTYWCLTEVDYSGREEAVGHLKPTNFALKISNCVHMDVLKASMILMMQYVEHRKRRPSPGWIMTEDDIFAFLQTLGFDNYHLRGVTFTITKSISVIAVSADGCEPSVIVWEMELPNNLAETEDSITGQAAKFKRELGDHTYCAPLPAKTADDKAGHSKSKKKKKNKDKNKGESVEREKATASGKGESVDREKATASGKGGSVDREKATASGKEGSVEREKTTASGKGGSVEAEKARASGERSEKGQDGTELTGNQQEQENADGTKPSNKPAATDSVTAAMSAHNIDSKPIVDDSKPIVDHSKPVVDDSKPVVSDSRPVVDDSNVTSEEKEAKTDEQNAKNMNKTVKGLDRDVGTQTSRISFIDEWPPTPKPEVIRLGSGGGDAAQKKTRDLSFCSKCGIKEPSLRSFKKCARCVEQKVVNVRYYCGKPCQVAHWKSQHQEEHLRGTL